VSGDSSGAEMSVSILTAQDVNPTFGPLAHTNSIYYIRLVKQETNR